MIRTRRRPIHHSFRSRLMVRALDERVTPTVFTVLNNADSGAGSLRQAILDATANPGADTIDFDSAYFGVPRVITISTTELSVFGSLSIIGPGKHLLTLDGNNSIPILQISTGSIASVSNLTFANGYSSDKSIGSGGALDLNEGLTSEAAQILIQNCDFVNNRSERGAGAINAYNDADDHISILNCTFTKNKAGFSGGAIFARSASIKIAGCVFSDNNVVSTEAFFENENRGGAVTLEVPSISILDSQFTNNSAKLEGGAIYSPGSGKDVPHEMIVEDCVIQANHAGGVGGGGIYVQFGTNLTVRRCDLSNNVVVGTQENENRQGGGAIMSFGGTYQIGSVTYDTFNGLMLDSCLIAGNAVESGGPTSEVSGGGVLFIGPTSPMGLNIRNSTIAGNVLGQGSHFGAGLALVDTGAVTLDNSTIANNIFSVSATQFPNVGGGIARFGTSGTTVLRSTIVAGNVTNGGVGPDINSSGPISVAASNSLIGVADSGSFSLSTNVANLLGTATAPLDPQFLPFSLYGGTTKTLGLKSTSPAIDSGSNPNTLFYDQRGEGFSRQAGSAPDIGAFERITEFFITNTNGAGSGSLRAALENSGVNPDAETISFSSNLFSTPQTITLTQTSSIDGSHIAYLGITGSVTINGPASGLTLQGAKAARIFHIDMIDAKSPVMMTNLRVIDGRALDGDGGGAILNKDAALTLTNCTFTANQTSLDGGAISLLTSDSTMTATDCLFIANSASASRGGALALASKSAASLIRTNFDSNAAFSVGGAIGVFNSNLTAMDCSIVNNVVQVDGGGIGVLGDNPFDSNDNSSTIKLTNCTIASNTAGLIFPGGIGGGIFLLYPGDYSIRNSTITKNVVTNSPNSGGGGIGALNNAGAILWSTIVAQNTGPCPDLLGGSGSFPANYSLIGIGNASTTLNKLPFGSGLSSDSTDIVGTVTMPIDPLLSAGPFQQGQAYSVYAVRPDSPARDKGAYPPSEFLVYDQRGTGFSRNAYPGVDIGSYEVNPPSAGANAPIVSSASNAPVLISVSFFEESGIDTTTLDNSDITVTGTGLPTPTPATFMSFAANGSGSYVATYLLAAPSGGWSYANNGIYTVTLQPNQIYDTDALGQPGFQNPVPGGNIGQFRVAIGAIFAVDTVLDNVDAMDGKMSLREAVNAGVMNSQASDTITFDPVVFAGHQTITLDNMLGGISSFDPLFVIGPADGVTILKTGMPALFDPPLFTIFSSEQTGGSSSKASGFVRVNFVGGGGFNGAVAITGGFVTLTDCSIIGSGAGGGLSVSRANMTLTRCTIADNIGSGLIANSSIVLVDSCTISGNTTTGDGGGIYASGYSPNHLLSVRNSTISGNQATNGGAIALQGLSLVLDNSTLADCVATGKANAISQQAYYSTKTIVARSTIFSGLSNEMFEFGSATFTANNCLFRFAPDEPLTPSSGNNLIAVDPLLDVLAANGGPTKTHALKAGSPALDKGSNPLLLDNDQRGSGFDRVSGSTADIGAYEYQVPPPPGTLLASFIGDATVGYRLVVLDEALDRNNDITFKYDGTNLIITDAKEAFTGLAETPDGKFLGKLSNGNRTISIPFAALTNFKAVDFLTAGGDDTLTMDWSAGLFPINSTYSGGKGNDYLVIKGGEFESIRSGFKLSTDGNAGGIAFHPPGGPDVELIYAELEPIDLLVDSVGSLEFDLPPTMSHAFLEDDGIVDNGISQIRSMNSTFEFTTFIAPTDSLVIIRGHADDTLALAALPDFQQNLTIGTMMEPFANVSITGPTTFAADKSIAIFAKTVMVGAALSATGTGTVNLNAAESLILTGNVAANGGTVIASPFVQILVPLDSGNGDIVIRGDDIRLDPAATINAGTVSVTFETFTPGVALELGVAGDVPGGPARLSLAELNQVTAAKMVLGSLTTGNVTIFNTIVRAAATNVVLISNGDINIAAGSIDTGGGSLMLTANGSVKPTLAGTDIFATKLTFGTGTDLNFDISGPNVDMQYSRLVVNGAVDLAGVDLQLTGTYAPAVNDLFFLVNATSIMNTFTGLAEGDTVTFNGLVMSIHYSSTAVTLQRVIPPCITATMVNDGAIQRSKITGLRVDFDQIVSFLGAPEAAFELRRNSDNSIVGITASVINTTNTQITFSFSGTATEFGSLTDGRYTLTAFASKITSSGLNLDGDCNGVAGDDYSFALHRLFGDADGNGTVTASDFSAFRVVYGSTGPSSFDFDGDNQVSASDFNEFRTRYGITLAP